MNSLNIVRSDIVLMPDYKRTLLRPFAPSKDSRFQLILKRVMTLTEKEVDSLLQGVISAFDGRHYKFTDYLLERYMHVRHHLEVDLDCLTENRKKLIGSYFTQEYSLESSALFNPSIVWSPDQSGLKNGESRFVLSLRAVGEGHISSICFRSGIITESGEITMEPMVPFFVAGTVVTNAVFHRNLFRYKLREIGISGGVEDEIFSTIGETFTMNDLERCFVAVSAKHKTTGSDRGGYRRAHDHILTLALSNYQVNFAAVQDITQIVLFPTAPTERNGIEDARFVKFEDAGTSTYYATYTAYNGSSTIPQIIQTDDFRLFKMSTLNGSEVSNKGMALFPRKIFGKYAMLSRQDNENIYLMLSDHPHFWTVKEKIMGPTHPWDFVQIGNCGSPIETSRGWLVLSHGVGPMRTYAISAFLLDIDDPRKVIGCLKEPLLTANDDERDGYVPNVLYSCGSIVKGDNLIIPYAFADYGSKFATVSLTALLDAMVDLECVKS